LILLWISFILACKDLAVFIVFGLLIGFLAAIPLGPVNVFIASQTLKRDFFHGFLAAATTAVLDFAYCAVALIGFFQIKINVGPALVPVMKVIAGIIVMLVGWRLIRDSRGFSLPENGGKLPPAASKPILGVLALYVTNPSLYIFWVAVAGAMTSHNLVRSSGWKAFAFAGACGLGALVWYSIIVHLLARHQDKLRPQTFRKVLFVLGVLLIGLGLYTIATAFFKPPEPAILNRLK
jgi:threonine/homoserine/homoserine lactone efflux protein